MIRHIATILWPVALVLAALTAFAFGAGADWPSERRGDFAMLVAIAAFMFLLATTLLRRMHGWDWLTIAFASVFLTMTIVFFYGVASRLWPIYMTQHRGDLIWIIRVSVLVSLVWATVQIIRTPDPEIEQQRRRAIQRKEDRAEGRAEGRITGHAEGMAQEHAVQLEREDAADRL